MRKIAAFLGSLATGVLLTAAGVAFELRTLLIAGLGLLGLAGLFWLLHWRTRTDNRIFLELEFTPSFLSGIFSGRTRVQAEKAIGIYLGKWIRVSGALKDVEVNASNNAIVTFADRRPTIFMYFRKGVKRLEVLHPGDVLQVQGRVAALDPNWVRLERCELLSVGHGELTKRAEEPDRTDLTIQRPAPAESAANFDWHGVVSLTPGQVETLMEGCARETIAGLRVIAQHGPVIRASLLDQAGIENYGHFQGRVTKRTRTITGDRHAYLFSWDDWQSKENNGVGHYAVTATTFRSLRIYFNLD